MRAVKRRGPPAGGAQPVARSGGIYSPRTWLLLRLVTSLPSTLESVEAGTVTILPPRIICTAPSGPTRYTVPRRAPSAETTNLPFAATADASFVADASPAPANIRPHNTMGNHEFFTTISLLVDDPGEY